MNFFRQRSTQRGVAFLLTVALFMTTSGCATLAHDASFNGAHARTVSHTEDEICPWILGDVGLLFLFVVPGVVAFIVDFGTGAWKHSGPGHVHHATEVAFAGPSTPSHTQSPNPQPKTRWQDITR